MRFNGHSSWGFFGAPVGRRVAVGARTTALLAALSLIAGLVQMLAWPSPAAAAAGDPPVLSVPVLVHSTGAELSWSRMTPAVGSTFTGYEVYRATSAGAAVGASTLLTRFTVSSRIDFIDSTAKPLTTYWYRVLGVTTSSTGTSTSAASNEVSLTTPAEGTAKLTLQESSSREQATVLRRYDQGGACPTSEQNGASTIDLSVGVRTTATQRDTSRALLKFDLRRIPATATINTATLTLTYAATPATALSGIVQALPVTRPWSIGAGAATCGADGATWASPEGGLAWSVPGGDASGSPISAAASTHVPSPAGADGTDTFAVSSLVQSWVNGDRVNHGLLLRMSDEAYPTAGSSRLAAYYPEDAATAARRPSLVVTFQDGSQNEAPSAGMATPLAGALVTGTVDLTADATDDGTVKSVEYQLDGASVGTVTAGAPWRLALNTVTRGVSAGTHTLRARATDDIGNVTLGAPITVTVDNSAAVTGTVTAPAAGATVTGTATLTASVSNVTRTREVTFFVDDTPVGTPDLTSPYSTSWATADQLNGLWNGAHSISARVTDIVGRVTTSPLVSVTVNNAVNTRYAATLAAQNPAAPAAGQPRDPVNPNDPFPPVIVTDTVSSTQDPYAGTTGSGATGGSGGSANKNLATAPTGTATTGACPAGAFCPTVNVTNTSSKTWTKGADYEVWYRWYAPNGAVMSEGRSGTGFPDNFATNATKAIPLIVAAPPLPPQAESAELRLRVDVYDRDTLSPTPAPKWFSQQGSAPIDVPVRVVRNAQTAAKDLDTKIGLEKFWTYEGEPTGAGSSALTNVANGNMLWRWTPMSLPGRGLSTGIDLTYNALEDHSQSVLGENFSLGLPTLTRLGEQLDVHPNKADRISGKSNKWISFADGDGTLHRFIGNTDGSWTAPAGVNLFLRKVGATESDPRYWAISRPDFVTFYYTYDGYPAAVVDRNNNTTTFTLETVPAGGDPGGPKQRVASLTEPGGRLLKFTYYAKSNATSSRVRGALASIANLSTPGSTTPGSTALRFDYYDDGNLLRVVQVGGVGTDGAATPDRSFVFTYTTSSGDAPALSAAARVTPDPHTPNQSVRLATITDPRGAETKLVYRGPGAGQQRWWLASRTNRSGQQTTFGYDLTARTTTVTDPGTHPTTFGYDTDGKVTSVTNPKGEKTSYQWNADFHPTTITDDDQVATSMTWNANGYLTGQTAPGEAGGPTRTTTLCYTNTAVDATDPGGHGSLLTAVIRPASSVATAADPCGSLTAGSTHTYRYSYTNKNVTSATDPEGNASTFVWNQDPSADRGTLASATDARGNATAFLGYHPSGQPTSVQDAEGGVTSFGYSNDGDPTFVQTPIHQSATGSNDAEYRTKMYYDPFHRPTRSSEPKTYSTQPGVLIWTGTTYDPNDNVTLARSPAYGSPDYPSSAPHTDTIFDAMDRPTSVVGPDRHLPGNEKTTFCYDSEGRVSKVLNPRSTATCSTAADHALLYDYDTLDRVIGTTAVGGSGEASRASWSCFDNVGNSVAAIAPNAALSSAPACGSITSGPHTSTVEYNPDHSVRQVTDPKGRTSLYRYDPNGWTESVRRQLTEGATPSYATDTLVRDQRGLVTKTTTPFEPGHPLTSLTDYDANGNKIREVSPRGYDAATDKAAVTDFTTGYRYDKLNRLSRVALPTGAGTPAAFEHYGYDANSRMTRKSLPVADADVADAAWSNIPVTSRTTYGILDTGWIEASDDNVTPQVMFDYTAEGWQTYRVPRLTKNNSSAWDTSLAMNWTYFNDGTLKTRQDEKGNLASYDYDANNNQTFAQSAAGVVDEAERAIRTTSAFNGFDQLARAEETKLLDDQATRSTPFTTFDYDRNGNLTFRGDEGKQNASGTITDSVKRNTFVYDSDDRLLRALAQGRDTGCGGDRRVTYDWTASAWLKTRTVAKSTGGCTGGLQDTADGAYPGWDTSQTENRTFLDNGDLATQTLTNATGTVLSTHTLSYDQKSADATLPSAYTGQRTRDRWAAGTGGQCQVATGGNPACVNAWQYDARGKLIDNQQTTLDTGSTLAHTTYALDEALAGRQADTDLRAGNVTTERDVVKGVTTTRTYTGNQLGTTSIGGVDTKTWFDKLGRVDCITLSAGTAGACSPRPDQTPAANLVTDYDYDYLDRLLSIRKFDAGTQTDKTTYVNDALDRVVSQNETHTRPGAAGGALVRTTAFTYSGLSGEVASEKQTANGSTSTTSSGSSTNGSTPACGPQNGSDTAQYTTSTNTKSYSYDPLGWRFQLADDLTCTAGAGTSYDRSTSTTFGEDPQGSVELVTRDQAETTTATVSGTPTTTSVTGAGQGSVRAKYAYGPYGALDKDRSQGDLDPTTVFNPWRYTGKRWDTGSGTLDMGARRYDPGTARFLQQDLFKDALGNLGLTLDPLSQNRYALAGGNPTSNIEVDGHRSVSVGGTFVASGSKPGSPRIISPKEPGSSGGGSGGSGGGSGGSGVLGSLKGALGDAADWSRDHAGAIGTGVAIGAGIAAGAAFCGATAGVGCLVIAGVAGGAAGGAAGYGTRVGLSRKETFDTGQFGKETVLGGAFGAVGGGLTKGAIALAARRAGATAAEAGGGGANRLRSLNWSDDTGAVSWGRGGQKLSPDNAAGGATHTTFRRGPDGGVTHYVEWTPNARSPRGYDIAKRYDGVGGSHYDRLTGVDVPTPHVQGPGGVRPADPWEIPR